MFHCPHMIDTASLIAPSNCRRWRNGQGRGRTRDSFAASCILKDRKQRGSPSNRTKKIAPDTSCPDLCPTWPGFKPILSSHYPQTYKAGQVVQVEGLVHLILQRINVLPFIPMNTQPPRIETSLWDACLWPCCTHGHYSYGTTYIFHSILFLILS